MVDQALGWFRGIDFKTLHLQEPPFKPELKDPSDTRYFDDDINDEPLRRFGLPTRDVTSG